MKKEEGSKDILREKAVASATTIGAGIVDDKKIIRNLYNNMLGFDLSSMYPFFTVALQNLATQCIPMYNVEIKTKEDELVLQIFLEDVIERAMPLFVEHKQRMINAVRRKMEGR